MLIYVDALSIVVVDVEGLQMEHPQRAEFDVLRASDELLDVELCACCALSFIDTTTMFYLLTSISHKHT